MDKQKTIKKSNAADKCSVSETCRAVLLFSRKEQDFEWKSSQSPFLAANIYEMENQFLDGAKNGDIDKMRLLLAKKVNVNATRVSDNSHAFIFPSKVSFL